MDLGFPQNTQKSCNSKYPKQKRAKSKMLKKVSVENQNNSATEGTKISSFAFLGHRLKH